MNSSNGRSFQEATEKATIFSSSCFGGKIDQNLSASRQAEQSNADHPAVAGPAEQQRRDSWRRTRRGGRSRDRAERASLQGF
jgi:hypothetical protein